MARRLAIWWVKRDARLRDNSCLEEAQPHGWELLPFFCFEPTIRQADVLRQLAAKTASPKLKAFAANELWQPVSEKESRATLMEFLTRRGLCYRGGIISPNTAFSAGSRPSVHFACERWWSAWRGLRPKIHVAKEMGTRPGARPVLL